MTDDRDKSGHPESVPLSLKVRSLVAKGIERSSGAFDRRRQASGMSPNVPAFVPGFVPGARYSDSTVEEGT
jgi:hypothetical protein